jgi:hypothetical protein
VDYVLKLPFYGAFDYFNLVKSIRPAVIAVTEGDPMIEKTGAGSFGGERLLKQPARFKKIFKF